MLTTILHRLVAIPCVYDSVQWMAGGPKISRRLAPLLEAPSPNAVVVDLGGELASSGISVHRRAGIFVSTRTD
jgi:hypothetical protein